MTTGTPQDRTCWRPIIKLQRYVWTLNLARYVGTWNLHRRSDGTSDIYIYIHAENELFTEIFKEVDLQTGQKFRH